MNAFSIDFIQEAEFKVETKISAERREEALSPKSCGMEVHCNCLDTERWNGRCLIVIGKWLVVYCNCLGGTNRGKVEAPVAPQAT